MAEEVDRHPAAIEVVRFIGDIIEKAGGAQEVADALTELGFESADGPYSERTVRSWRSGRHFPRPPVIFGLAKHYEISLDAYAFGAMAQVAEDAERRRRELERPA